MLYHDVLKRLWVYSWPTISSFINSANHLIASQVHRQPANVHSSSEVKNKPPSSTGPAISNPAPLQQQIANRRSTPKLEPLVIPQPVVPPVNIYYPEAPAAEPTHRYSSSNSALPTELQQELDDFYLMTQSYNLGNPSNVMIEEVDDDCYDSENSSSINANQHQYNLRNRRSRE